MYYDHKLPGGKNNNFFYMITSQLRQITPKGLFRRRLQRTLDSLHGRQDEQYILDRVEYYNKLNGFTPIGQDAVPLSQFRKPERKTTNYYDTFEYTRWFPNNKCIKYLFGDITHVPDSPTLLKSRPIAGDNANSVLLNLGKIRHFTFVRDRKTFRQKADTAVSRGHITGKPARIRFVEMFFGDPRVDVGVVNPPKDAPREWSEGKRISINQHLDHKFILTLEGNDVASNMKWVMSSNSLAVVPKLVYETWFMEGKLIPGVHFVEIKEDYSDLHEKMDYYIAHPDEAEKIIENAHEYIRQFLNPKRERLISLLVLDKYFRLTN